MIKNVESRIDSEIEGLTTRMDKIRESTRNSLKRVL